MSVKAKIRDQTGYVDKPEDWRYSSAPFYSITREGWPEGYAPLLPIVPIWQRFYEEGWGGYT